MSDTLHVYYSMSVPNCVCIHVKAVVYRSYSIEHTLTPYTRKHTHMHSPLL